MSFELLAILAQQARRRPRADESDNSALWTLLIWVAIIAFGAISNWWKQKRAAEKLAAETARRELSAGAAPVAVVPDARPRRRFVEPTPDDPFEEFRRRKLAEAYNEPYDEEAAEEEEEGSPGRAELDTAKVEAHTESRMCASIGADAAPSAYDHHEEGEPIFAGEPVHAPLIRDHVLPGAITRQLNEAQLLLVASEIFQRPKSIMPRRRR